MKFLLTLFFLVFWSSCSEQQDSSINSIDSPDNENIVIAEECNEDGQLIFDADKEQHFFCLGASKEWIPLRYDSLLKVENRISKTEDVSVIWKSIDSLVISWENGESSVSVEPWKYIPEFPQGDFEKFDGFTVIQDSIFRNSCTYVEGEWLVYVRNDKRFYRCASSQWEAVELTEVKEIILFRKSIALIFSDGKYWNVTNASFGETQYALRVGEPPTTPASFAYFYFDVATNDEYFWKTNKWYLWSDTTVGYARSGPGGSIDASPNVVNNIHWIGKNYWPITEGDFCLMAWVKNGEIIKDIRTLYIDETYELKSSIEAYFYKDCEYQVNLRLHEGVVGNDSVITWHKSRSFYYNPEIEDGYVFDYLLIDGETCHPDWCFRMIKPNSVIDVFAKKHLGIPFESEYMKHAICKEYNHWGLSDGCWVPYSDKIFAGSSRLLVQAPNSGELYEVAKALPINECPLWKTTGEECPSFWALPMAYNDSIISAVFEPGELIDPSGSWSFAEVGWIFFPEMQEWDKHSYLERSDSLVFMRNPDFSLEYKYPAGDTLILVLVEKDKMLSDPNLFQYSLPGRGEWVSHKFILEDFRITSRAESPRDITKVRNNVVGLAILKRVTKKSISATVVENQKQQSVLQIKNMLVHPNIMFD